MTFEESEATSTISDVPEIPHTYMAMKPIQKCKSPALTTQHVFHPTTSGGDHDDAVIYVSPTLVRKQGKAHSNLKEEPSSVNTEDGQTYCEISTDIPNIVKDHTDQSDLSYVFPDVPEEPNTYMDMKPILQCISPARNRLQVPHPTTLLDHHGDVVTHVSPILVRKIVKAHFNLKEEPTFVKTEDASTYCEINTDIPNIIQDHADSREDVVTTYL